MNFTDVYKSTDNCMLFAIQERKCNNRLSYLHYCKHLIAIL